MSSSNSTLNKMSSSLVQYRYAAVWLVLPCVGVTFWCWWKSFWPFGKKRGRGKGDKDNDTERDYLDEEEDSRSLVSTRIAKFETKSKARIAPFTPQQQNKPQVERCPACRKVVPTVSNKTKDIVVFRGEKVHVACFQCCDCQVQLTVNRAAIEQHSANVRVKFQCPDCHEKFQGALARSASAAKPSRMAGDKVVIAHHEQGDTKQTKEVIGDDLAEAVYFMHPKCCVCGGNFTQDNKMDSYYRGNWRYHQSCYWQQRQDQELKQDTTIQKLTPAQSAKYLPDQLILQLYYPDAKNNNTILTTLYFVWKDQHVQSLQLRKQHKDDKMVSISYSLDDQAPANPNYEPQNNAVSTINVTMADGMIQHKKRKPGETVNTTKQTMTKKEIPLPSSSSSSSDTSALNMRLLAANEVAPKTPQMPEPATTDEQSLCAKLEYYKFGLRYELKLEIPVLVKTSSQGGEGRQLKLDGALLSVAIQE